MVPKSKSKKEEPVEPGSDVVMEDEPTSAQPESRDDMSVDQNEDEDIDDFEEEEEEEEVQRVRLVCQDSSWPRW